MKNAGLTTLGYECLPEGLSFLFIDLPHLEVSGSEISIG